MNHPNDPACCDTCESGYWELDGTNFCVNWTPTMYEDGSSGTVVNKVQCAEVFMADFLFLKGTAGATLKLWE